MDLEARRANWGWFGKPWPSEICFEGERLREEMRKEFPDGEACLWCEQPFEEGDSGTATPLYDTSVTIAHVHKECQLFVIIGPLGDIRVPEGPGAKFRAAALKAWGLWGTLVRKEEDSARAAER